MCMISLKMKLKTAIMIPFNELKKLKHSALRQHNYTLKQCCKKFFTSGPENSKVLTDVCKLRKSPFSFLFGFCHVLWLCSSRINGREASSLVS